MPSDIEYLKLLFSGGCPRSSKTEHRYYGGSCYNVRVMKKGDLTSRRVPESSAASGEDVAAAIEALTEQELRRLKQYARSRILILNRRASGRNHHDLLQQAVTDTLSGERRWNKEAVDFLGHLVGAMRSIAWKWGKQFDADEPHLESESIRTGPSGKEYNPVLNATSPALDARRVAAAKAQLEHVESLVAGRPLAALIVAGMCDKMTGPEIKQELEISQTQLETEMRWVRRTLRADQDKGERDAE